MPIKNDTTPKFGEDEDPAYALRRGGDGGSNDLVAYGFKFHQGSAAHGIGYEEEQSPTLTADWHQPAVFLQGSIPENAINRPTGGTNGPMAYNPEDPAPTLRASKEVPAVCLAFVQNQRDEVRLMGGDGQIAGAVTASQFTKGQSLVCISNDADPTISDLSSTLKACHDGVPRVLCVADDTANAAIDTDLCGTLKRGGMPPAITMPECWCDAPAFSKRPGQQIATSDDGLSYALTRSGVPRVLNGQAGVRRLTPTECERLQGFPDGWTQLGETPDSPRYKALGNSMAVPVIRWLGERIEAVDAL